MVGLSALSTRTSLNFSPTGALDARGDVIRGVLAVFRGLGMALRARLDRGRWIDRIQAR